MRPCLFGVVFGPDFGIVFCSAFCSALGIAVIVVFAALLTYGVFCSRARKPNKTRLFANSVPHGPCSTDPVGSWGTETSQISLLT